MYVNTYTHTELFKDNSLHIMYRFCFTIIVGSKECGRLVGALSLNGTYIKLVALVCLIHLRFVLMSKKTVCLFETVS